MDRREKAEGQIRNIGFSYHGNTEHFKEVLDAYDWDFCQIQYNYMDEHTQAGRAGLEYAGTKGIPVIIMEPLRGGKLVELLPEEAKKLFREKSPDSTPAPVGVPVALGSEGSDSGAVRHEFSGNGAREYKNRR